MNFVVLVKHVPDTASDRRLTPETWTVDRAVGDAVLDEIDARGVETALQLAERHGGEVTAMTMGPEGAADALRKALAMGAHHGVHVIGDDLAGADALRTSAALASAIRTLPVDLVLTGDESTDGGTGLVGPMLAERLGWQQLTAVRELTVSDGRVTAEQVTADGLRRSQVSMPTVVSVVEKITEPRYPSFKGMMAAKRMPIVTLTPADLGLVDAPASTRVLDAESRPPRAAGRRIAGGDEVVGQLVSFLHDSRLI